MAPLRRDAHAAGRNQHSIFPSRPMTRLTCLVIACLLASCTETMPTRSSNCIPGDPSGSLQCQAATYSLAF